MVPVTATMVAASTGVNKEYQFCMMFIRACGPISVAQLTSQRTISLRRQVMVFRVIRITCRPSSRAMPSNVVSGGALAGVAVLQASCASLKSRAGEWMFCWMEPNTACSHLGSPLAAVSMVEASSHWRVSRWPRMNQRGKRLLMMESSGLP